MIDLKRLIKENYIDKSALAKDLFPDNKHPNMALKRLINGGGNLTSIQLEHLSIICRRTIDYILTEYRKG